MALYRYIKVLPSFTRVTTVSSWSRFLAFSLMGVGSSILVLVLASFAYYELRAGRDFRSESNWISGYSLKKPAETFAYGQRLSETTQLEEWFPTAPKLPVRQVKITHYNLSIPVLKIQQAIVEIGGDDLGKSMIHYPGSALPGEVGNSVIFCHSVLPQFFNPRNYKTICSTLPTVEIGDEIIVNFDGVEYRYQIFEMEEVSPNDISVLKQDETGEYLTMVTCVPPGTYLRRLVVKARLI